jgi:hypothetical protein
MVAAGLREAGHRVEHAEADAQGDGAPGVRLLICRGA